MNKKTKKSLVNRKDTKKFKNLVDRIRKPKKSSRKKRNKSLADRKTKKV